MALSILGCATASLSGDFDTAREMVDRAVAFNPNSAFAWEQRGWTYRIAGQPEEAIRSFERAIRLSPFDPWLFRTFTGMGIAFIGLGRFDEAVAAAKKALQPEPDLCAGLSLPRGSFGSSGARSRSEGGGGPVCSRLKPDFRISEWVARSGQRHGSDVYRRSPQSWASRVTPPSRLAVPAI